MTECDRRGGRGRLRLRPESIRSLALGVVLSLAFGATVHAENGRAGSELADPEAEDVLSVPGRSLPGEPVGSGQGEPGLDDLLKLPSGFTTRDDAKPVAGASEEEWRRRFSRAEKAIGEAREALVETRREMDGLAESGGASQWSVAPPGAAGQAGDGGTSPLSFKLRQELVRSREALEEAEKALRELKIEADLAGVPPAWRVVAANPSIPSDPADPSASRSDSPPVEN